MLLVSESCFPALPAWSALVRDWRSQHSQLFLGVYRDCRNGHGGQIAQGAEVPLAPHGDSDCGRVRPSCFPRQCLRNNMLPDCFVYGTLQDCVVTLEGPLRHAFDDERSVKCLLEMKVCSSALDLLTPEKNSLKLSLAGSILGRPVADGLLQCSFPAYDIEFVGLRLLRLARYV